MSKAKKVEIDHGGETHKFDSIGKAAARLSGGKKKGDMEYDMAYALIYHAGKRTERKTKMIRVIENDEEKSDG